MVTPNQFINDMYEYHRPTSSGSSSFLKGSSFVPVYAGPSSYWNHSTTYISRSDPHSMRQSRQYQKEDQENARAKSAAVAGGFAVIGLAGVAAFFGRNFLDSKRKLNEAFEFQNTEMKHLSPEVYSELQPVLERHIDILNLKQEWGKQIVVLTGSALATAIAAFAGGMLGIQWLITASIVAAVAVTSIGVFLAIWHYTNPEASMPLSMISTLDKLRNYHSPEMGQTHLPA